MDFTLRPIDWVCLKCGLSPLCVKTGVSSNGELVATWRCSKCKAQKMATLPIEDLIARVPPPPEKLLLEAKKEEITPEEINWLKEAHIQWEEKNDTSL